MDKLKNCPFCGQPFEILPSVNMDGHWAYKHNSIDCPMERNELTGWVWSDIDVMGKAFNTRPIEDSLRETILDLVKIIDASLYGEDSIHHHTCPAPDHGKCTCGAYEAMEAARLAEYGDVLDHLANKKQDATFHDINYRIVIRGMVEAIKPFMNENHTPTHGEWKILIRAHKHAQGVIDE